jgi:two-component SAPR family response regulator
MVQNFIVVDDDSVNNMICRKIIGHVLPDANIRTFLDPDSALFYIESTYANPDSLDAVVFLDINMPTLTGWEFLDAYEKFDTRVKEHLKVYMLSSSIDPLETERAARNNNVCDFFSKPLTRKCVERICSILI